MRAFREGVAFFRAARYADARSSFEQALDSDPLDVDTSVRLGFTCLELGDAPAAASHFERAAQIDPTRADANFGWGQALIGQGRREQALWKLDRASQLDEQSLTPLLVAGHLLRTASEEGVNWRKQDALIEAETRFERAIERDADDPAPWLGLGLTRKQAGDIDGSCDAFERASALDRSSVDARLRLGEALLKTERPDAAIKALEEALAVTERQKRTLVEARLYLAIALRQTRRFESALEQLQALLAEVRAARAIIEAGAVESRGAEHPDARALEESIQYAQILQAGVLGDLKRYDEAKEILDDAATSDTAVTPLVLLDAAVLAARRGHHAVAWQTLARADEALAGVPSDDPHTTLMRIELLRFKGRFSDARRALEAELASRTDDLDLLALSMRLAVEQSRFELEDVSSAHWYRWRAFERAVARLHARESRPSSALALGWWHLVVDEYEEAERHLTEAIDRDRHAPEPRAYLGIVLSRLGRVGEAAECLNAALRRDPYNDDIKVALAQSYAELGSLEQAERLYREIIRRAPASIEALVGLAAVLNNREESDLDGYEEAERHLLEASRLAATMNLDLAARQGSTRLTPRQQAALQFGVGYARVKQYESQAAGRVSVMRIRVLNRAQDAFEAAEAADPTLTRAARARQRIKQNRLDRAQNRAPVVLAALIMTLLTLFTAAFLFDWPARVEELTGTTYSVLVLGLILLLIAVLSLPHVSKLSIAGGSLEKAPDTIAIPLEFGIERDPSLATMLRVDLATPGMPTVPSEPEARRQARKGARDSATGAGTGEH